jgi:hypothetical protein
LQLADVDDAYDFLRQLRALGDDPQLGVLTGGSRIQIHRTDEDRRSIDDRGLGVQAAKPMP